MKIKLPIRKPRPPLKQPLRLKLKASVARSRRAPIVEEEDFLEEPEPNMKLSHAFVVVLVLHVIAVAGVFAFNSIKTKQSDIFSAMKEQPSAAATTAADASIAAENNATAAPEAAATAHAAAHTPPIAPEPAASKTYELQPGETLTKVASMFGVTAAEIQTANSIEDPTKIRAGTMLVIPGAGAAPAPAKAEPAPYKPIAAQPAESVPVEAVPVAAAPVAVPSHPAAPAASGVRDSGEVYVVVKGDNPVKIAKHLNVPYSDLMKLNGNPDPTKLQIGQKLKVPASN